MPSFHKGSFIYVDFILLLHFVSSHILCQNFQKFQRLSLALLFLTQCLYTYMNKETELMCNHTLHSKQEFFFNVLNYRMHKTI